MPQDWDRVFLVALANQPFDFSKQLSRPYWLRNIAVHTGGEAPLLIALQRMSCHSNDWDMRARRILLCSNCCSSLEAIHLRHLNVHEHDVEALFLECTYRCPTVAYDGYRITSFLEQADRKGLIYGIIFGQKNSRSILVLAQGMSGN